MREFYVTKADGTSEPFRKEKLIGSLINAGAKQELAEAIADDVIANAVPGVSTSVIYKKAFKQLRREHRPTAARYSLRRALFDLGPTGFPFEDFVSELYQKMGYTTETRQVVSGRCVTHELDVIARKGEECIMIEVKFHNAVGYKTNVKTALYVRARMNDIFARGGSRNSHCPITRAILLTNTKFTSNAIAYAVCEGLEIVGWSYPEKESLLDLMIAHNVYPITALTTLSASQKRALIERGILLCAKLERNQEVLMELGLSKLHMKDVLQESRELCTMPYEAVT